MISVNVVIVDACRDVPIQVTARVFARAARRCPAGFAPTQPPPTGIIVASDRAIVQTRPCRGVSETDAEQKPWEISNLIGDFSFEADARGECDASRSMAR
ncbi:MAG: hypothetical protein ABIU95_13915 [Burkholderiales bacterium]